jgi:hypothetical protein
LNIFLKEGVRLINTPPGFGRSIDFGTDLYIDNTKKFVVVRGNNKTQPLGRISEENSPSYPKGGFPKEIQPKGHVFARIKKDTGEIFSQAGQKSKGTIFSKWSGTELISRRGVTGYDEFILAKVTKLEKKESAFVAYLYVNEIMCCDIVTVIRNILCEIVLAVNYDKNGPDIF